MILSKVVTANPPPYKYMRVVCFKGPKISCKLCLYVIGALFLSYKYR